MQMSLSADGRYYHGKSKNGGYIIVTIDIADELYKKWLKNHPNAPMQLKESIEKLHSSASFWEMIEASGVHVINSYISVEYIAPNSYKVSCIEHEKLHWDYTLKQMQLQQWVPTLSCLLHTSSDPLCGIYAFPEGAVLPLWDTA